jgi:flagellar motor switch protein FliG
MMERLGITEDRYFDFITTKDVDYLLTFLNKQLPQTIALILLHLKKDVAAEVLEQLPGEIRATVIKRASSIRKVDTETVKTLRKTLEEQLLSTIQTYKFAGMPEAAEMIKRIDTNIKNGILQDLDNIDPQLKGELEKQMFRFEGLNLIDDEGLQLVLRSQEISNQNLAYAMKSCLPKLKERILQNLPPNRTEDVEYEMETTGRVQLWKVEQAQQQILEVARKLIERGEISTEEEGGYVE